ncbi:MAG: Holliday junction resolvase RuvX [Phycisphaeraceae bacterium]|nr:Holliday junction resolvase RuvX [Phycisphaeraceae bacterium]MCB9846954.1 Holliday junction resolvase RuvX [Phycisphaeraceae bacterium]
MRYLAIDLGDKRTGLAVGDDLTGIVTPREVLSIPRLPAPDRLLDAIAARIDEFGPDELVLGLPLNMDGSEGPQAKAVREFGAALAERSGLEVRYQDERLTSAEAEWTLAGSGRTHGQKKALRDALAAAAILRDYLDATTG